MELEPLAGGDGSAPKGYMFILEVKDLALPLRPMPVSFRMKLDGE